MKIESFDGNSFKLNGKPLPRIFQIIQVGKYIILENTKDKTDQHTNLDLSKLTADGKSIADFTNISAFIDFISNIVFHLDSNPANQGQGVVTEYVSALPEDTSEIAIGTYYIITDDGTEDGNIQEVYQWIGIDFLKQEQKAPLVPTQMTESERGAWQTWLNNGVATNQSFDIRGMIPSYVTPNEINQDRDIIGLNLNQIGNGAIFKFYDSTDTEITTISVPNYTSGEVITASLDVGNTPIGAYTMKILYNNALTRTEIEFKVVDISNVSQNLPQKADWKFKSTMYASWDENTVDSRLEITDTSVSIVKQQSNNFPIWGNGFLCDLGITDQNDFMLKLKYENMGGEITTNSQFLDSVIGLTQQSEVATSPSGVFLGFHENWGKDGLEKVSYYPIGVHIPNPMIEDWVQTTHPTRSAIIQIMKSGSNFTMLVKDLNNNTNHTSTITDIATVGAINLWCGSMWGKVQGTESVPRSNFSVLELIKY